VNYVDFITDQIFNDNSGKSLHTYAPFPAEVAGDKYSVKFVDDGNGIKVYIVGPVGIYPYKDYNDLLYLKDQKLGIVKSGKIYTSGAKCSSDCTSTSGTVYLGDDCLEFDYASQESLSTYFLLKKYCSTFIERYQPTSNFENRMDDCKRGWEYENSFSPLKDDEFFYEPVKSIELATVRHDPVSSDALCSSHHSYKGQYLRGNCAEVAWVLKDTSTGYNRLSTAKYDHKEFTSQELFADSLLEKQSAQSGKTKNNWIGHFEQGSIPIYHLVYKTDALVLSVGDGKNRHIFFPQIAGSSDEDNIFTMDEDNFFGHGYLSMDAGKMIVDNIGQCT
jgi:hypothetical protein